MPVYHGIRTLFFSFLMIILDAARMTKKIFRYELYPRKLNLGCGLDKKEGYVNVDLKECHNPDLLCDVSLLTPLPDDYYHYILAKDILEHIPKNRCENTLLEWNRILEVGGILEIRVPDVLGICRLLQHPGSQTLEAQNLLLNNLFGTQNYEGDFHYNGFTEIVIRSLLAKTGFSVGSITILDDWLFHITAQKIVRKRCHRMYHLESDDAFLKTAFLEILDREVDPEGMDFYMSRLESGILRESIVNSLKGSDEYIQRQLKKNRN